MQPKSSRSVVNILPFKKTTGARSPQPGMENALEFVKIARFRAENY